MRKVLSILATSVASVVAFAPMAQAELAEVGAISPDNGYPLYYGDGTTYQGGAPLRLAPCLSGATVAAAGVPGPLCLLATNFDPALGADVPPIMLNPANAAEAFPTNYFWDTLGPLTDPITGNSASFTNVQTFQDEFFYWHADASFATADDAGGAPGRGLILFALEGAFAGGPVAANDQIVFSRVRIRLDNLQDGETYTITTPYGVYTQVADGVGTRNINFTEDLGSLTPGQFAAVLTAHNTGPFLQPATVGFNPATNEGGPITATDPFTGDVDTFIADPNVPQTVTGSTFAVAADFGTSATPGVANFVRIEGPGVAAGLTAADLEPGQALCAPELGPDPIATDDCIENNLLTVNGMIASHFGVNPLRTSYTRGATGTGRVDVLVTSVTGQELHATMGARDIQLFEDPAVTGRYFGRFSFNTGSIPLLDSIELSNLTDIPPTVTTSTLVDSVTVQQATFNTTGLNPSGEGTLTLRANSSDNITDANEVPSLTAFTAFGDQLLCTTDGVNFDTVIPDNVTVTCPTFAVGAVQVRSTRNPNSLLDAGGGGVADQNTVITGPNVSGP